MSFEIKRHIATLNDSYNTSKELNYVSWNNAKPQYDLRKWRDGEALKGISLDEKEAMMLLEALAEEFGYRLEPIEEEIPEYEERNIIIYGRLEDCVKVGHDYEEVQISLPVFEFGRLVEKIVTGRYCRTCKHYYISEYTYKSIKETGRIACSIMSLKQYENYICNKTNTNWQEQSILNTLGYNVGKEDDFSEKYRRNILAYIIQCGLMKKEVVINYLNWFIKNSESRLTHQEAVRKWRSDRDFLLGKEYDEVARRIIRPNILLK